MNFWPYHSGNAFADVVLYGVYTFLFGWFFGLGWRVAQKLP